jgi:hypothetical protein
VLDTAEEASSIARQQCLLGSQDAPLPLFDQIKAEDVVPGITALVDELNSELDALEVEVGKTEPTWASLVEPLERLTDRISRAWGAVSHLKVWAGDAAALPLFPASLHEAHPLSHTVLTTLLQHTYNSSCCAPLPQQRRMHAMGMVCSCACVAAERRQTWLPGQAVKDSEAMRGAVEEVQPLQVALSLRLAQSRPLYEGFRVRPPSPPCSPAAPAGSHAHALIACSAHTVAACCSLGQRRTLEGRFLAHVPATAERPSGPGECQGAEKKGRTMIV